MTHCELTNIWTLPKKYCPITKIPLVHITSTIDIHWKTVHLFGMTAMQWPWNLRFTTRTYGTPHMIFKISCICTWYNCRIGIKLVKYLTIHCTLTVIISDDFSDFCFVTFHRIQMGFEGYFLALVPIHPFPTFNITPVVHVGIRSR